MTEMQRFSQSKVYRLLWLAWRIHVAGNADIVRKIYLDLEGCFWGLDFILQAMRHHWKLTVEERLSEMHRAREEGLLIIVYKATGMKPSLEPGLSKKWQSPFVPLTNLAPPYQGKTVGEEGCCLCLLLIALIGCFNEAPFCLSVPLVLVNFPLEQGEISADYLFIGVTMLAFHLPNEILQLAVKLAGSQLYLAKESNKSKQCAEKGKNRSTKSYD